MTTTLQASTLASRRLKQQPVAVRMSGRYKTIWDASEQHVEGKLLLLAALLERGLSDCKLL